MVFCFKSACKHDSSARTSDLEDFVTSGQFMKFLCSEGKRKHCGYRLNLPILEEFITLSFVITKCLNRSMYCY